MNGRLEARFAFHLNPSEFRHYFELGLVEGIDARIFERIEAQFEERYEALQERYEALRLRYLEDTLEQTLHEIDVLGRRIDGALKALEP